MSRSKLMSVLAFSAIVSLGACARGEHAADTAAVDTATSTVPAPMPAPMPMDTGMMTDTSMKMDTTRMDTSMKTRP
jgi:hypothetical protein